jgi:bifunctional pyridoxal-dependent enzyme with beta-cystathionase and maltose regulon repressor activities
MELFSNDKVNLDALKKKAFNYRWATLPDDVIPLTAADPDFPVAEPIVQAITDYSKDGYFSYGPPEGLLAFKEAIP